MDVNVLTLFPEIVKGPLDESIIKRAIQKGLLTVNFTNIRDFALGKHKQVDDSPYGGGPGMVLKVDVLDRAVSSVLTENSYLVTMDPRGQKLDQKLVVELSSKEKLVVVCGHYEGIDERFYDIHQPHKISIGDYVLTNGALAAAVMIDAVSRYIPGVLGNEESLSEETFVSECEEYPQFTRPQEYSGHEVPKVLMSGNHEKIKSWRTSNSKKFKNK